MDSAASMHICLLNNLIRHAFIQASSVSPLSPDAIKKLEASREGWQNLRSRDFSRLLLMTMLVAVGVILEGPELIYEIREAIRRWRNRPARDHSPGWITAVGIVGWILVSVGVAGEFWVDSWVNRDDDHIQSINITLLTDAGSSADRAAHSAQVADSRADAADAAAGNAQQKASNALTLARGARSEADSFEHDIVSAKNEAADAESHQAEALKQAVAATAELNILKSPRTLTNAMGFSSALRRFAGTEYTFSGVSESAEAIDLLKQIDSALQLAGWTRVKPSPAPTIVLNVYGKEQDFGTAITASTGVEVEVDSTDSIGLLMATPHEMWPRQVQIAAVLRNALANSITPAEGNVRKDVVVEQGSSPAIRIMVGMKP